VGVDICGAAEASKGRLEVNGIQEFPGQGTVES